ncbi:MAG: hypothetical protein QNJ44_22705 [Rhodobacter sp.]|nr:hypothetical protein [Rhodobacter sp.]
MTPQLAYSDDGQDLPDYPFTAADRLDSHWFVPWERRRWLNSDMRLKGTPECRALYFDLINIAYDQSPIGTLPTDNAVLAKLLFVPESHFAQLCGMAYGPLHKWRRCRCEGEVRLMHDFVLHTLLDAVSRREDNRARMEAANRQKRLQRLRSTVAGLHTDLARNDAAMRWIDDYLTAEGCEYRSTTWVERAIGAWSTHIFDLNNRGIK